MTKALLLLTILPFLSSCSLLINANHCDYSAERIYEKDNSFQIKAGDYYDQEITDVALDVFEDMWSKSWGDSGEVNNMVNNICIIWEPYLFELEGLPETKEGLPGRAAGQTESDSRVRVYISEKREISSTALIHELVHVMLWRVNGDPDPDHEGDAYKGWSTEHNLFINQAKVRLREELTESE